MIIITYQKKNHGAIIRVCADALKQGRAVAYPTDTSYGLAVDAANVKAIRKLYRIKGRNFKKPVHVIAPSVAYAGKIVRWNRAAEKLAKKYWPGPLTLVLELRAKDQGLRKLSAGTGGLGIRQPKNNVALDLAKHLKHPITATSANSSGQGDCYSLKDILGQFSAKGGSAFGGKNERYKPDIIIDAGKLPRRRPSTLIKINRDSSIQILREGPISKKQIKKLCY